MYRTLLLVSFFLILLSCKKDPDPVVPVQAGGSWIHMSGSTTASYSETVAKKGYTLRFSNLSGSQSVSFLFRAKPASSLTFSAAADTSRPGNVGVSMESDGRLFHAVNANNLNVDVSLYEGKLHLKASGILMAPDTNTAQQSTLDFDLREF